MPELTPGQQEGFRNDLRLITEHGLSIEGLTPLTAFILAGKIERDNPDPVSDEASRVASVNFFEASRLSYGGDHSWTEIMALGEKLHKAKVMRPHPSRPDVLEGTDGFLARTKLSFEAAAAMPAEKLKEYA